MPDPTRLASIAGGTSDPSAQLADEIRSLRQRISDLETARSGNAMTVDGQPGIVLRGGAITAYDVDDHAVGILGTGPSGATGIEVARPDGTPIFWAVTSAGGFAALFDQVGNYVVTDDSTSGQGLARPFVPFGQFTDNSVPTQGTTSTTFTTLQICPGYKQHPKLVMQVLVYAPSPGQVRVIDQDGNQLGATVTLAAGAFQYVQFLGVLPGAHMLPVSLNVQARLTSGSSPIAVRGVSAIGVESATF